VNPLFAVLLGIVQGLTEFLPISSTAHLTLTGKLLGLVDPRNPGTWTAFIAVMQLGTLGAVLLYFWRDITTMALALLKDVRTNGGGEGFKGYSRDSRLALLIVLGSIPVGTVGLGLHKIIEGSLTKNLYVISASLFVLALCLWLAERIAKHQKTFEHLTWVDALIIGFAQAMALIPGSSRSGTTMTAGLFVGLTRNAAARFSFLLSVPAVFASGLYELWKIDTRVFDLGIESLIVATGVSAITGYVAIAWLLRYLMKHTTMVFVWYRILLAALLILLIQLGAIEP
jgi:undecaprenyl-diphosphatase